MSLSKRDRRRHEKTAARMLPEAPVLQYVVGSAGPYPTLVNWAIFAGFVATAVALSVLIGGVAFPGLLVAFGIKYGVCTPRGIVVNPLGVAVVDRSFATSKPNRVILRVTHAQTQPVEKRGTMVRVAVGPERIWLAKKEHQLLGQAVAHAMTMASPLQGSSPIGVPAPPAPPVTGGSFTAVPPPPDFGEGSVFTPRPEAGSRAL